MRVSSASKVITRDELRTGVDVGEGSIRKVGPRSIRIESGTLERSGRPKKNQQETSKREWAFRGWGRRGGGEVMTYLDRKKI